jgi:SAM-dependent methyltransferase
VGDDRSLLVSEHATLQDLLDSSRVASIGRIEASDFDGAQRNGRGDEYRRAQRDPTIRGVGIRTLFELAFGGHRGGASLEKGVVLDLLGGDGTLARAFSTLMPGRGALIITSDISADMVASAIAYGLPAIRQPATCLVLRDASVDVAIIAYGTHHIPRHDLPQVLQETARVLTRGGRILIHDFPENSPVSEWFRAVVHRESRTGHDFRHFRRGELRDLLLEAGFRNVSERLIYDPFVVVGTSRNGVQQALAEHLLEMYGLRKLIMRLGEDGARATVYALARRYFHYRYAELGLDEDFGQPGVAIVNDGHLYRAEVPRVAVVARGDK